MNTQSNVTSPYPVWNSQQQIQMKAKAVEPTDNQNQETPPAKDDENLGEGGVRALAAERKRADDEKKRADKLQKQISDKEAEGQSDLEKANSKIAEQATTIANLTTENMQFKVGLANKVDPTLIPRLRGDDEAAMTEDAKALVALTPQGPKVPKADPSQGRKAEGDGSQTPKEDFIDTMDELFDKQ